MISIPLAQAKKHLSELISKVEAGEIVSVTRRGRPVARLVKCSDDSTGGAQGEQVQQALSHLRHLRQGVRLEGEIREIAREGLA